MPDELEKQDHTFGEVEDVDAFFAEEEKPPIEVPMIGYDRATHERQDFTFKCRGEAPKGQMFNVVRLLNARGQLQTGAAFEFIYIALIDEDERERFTDTLDDPKLKFRDDVVGDVCAFILEAYSDRPTRSRSERRASTRRTGRPGAGGRSATGSTPRRSG